MLKRIILLLVISVFFLSSSNVFADQIKPNLGCNPDKDTCLRDDKGSSYSCQPDFYPNGDPVVNHNTGKQEFVCKKGGIGSIFGTVNPPSSLQKFISGDPTGTTAISKFLSNLIQLIYMFAAIALLGMLLWGAFDWIVSEGDKEKVASAQRKIINAVIGIVLFAVAFAVLRVLGTFTGFTFFGGQNFEVISRNSQGEITVIRCTNKSTVQPGLYNSDGSPIKNPESWCK